MKKLISDFESCAARNFDKIDNMGILSPNSAQFISSALESFLIQKNENGYFYIDQETLWTSFLYEPFPRSFWPIYTRHNLSTIICDECLLNVIKNFQYILEMLHTIGFKYEAVYIAGYEKTIEYLSTHLDIINQCIKLPLNNKFGFSAPNIKEGEYIKFFTIYKNKFFSIADITISRSKDFNGFFSDSFLFVDNILIIQSGLETKYELKKYDEIKNILNRTDVFYENSHLELLLAIKKCMDLGLSFGARGRNYLVKEMLKIFFYQRGTNDFEFWTEFCGKERIKRINEIYVRETKIFTHSLDLAAKKKRYDIRWKEQFGITKKTYDFAYKTVLGEEMLLDLYPQIIDIYVDDSMPTFELVKKLDEFLIKDAQSLSIELYDL